MTKKTRFDVNLLLPGVPDSRDACFRRMSDLLEARTGVEAAHLVERSDGQPGQLCVHFDPEIISSQDVRRAAQQAGAALQEKYGHLLRDTAPMRPGQAKRLTLELSLAKGVLEATVSPHGAVRVEFDRELADEAAIAADIDRITGRDPKSATPLAAPQTHQDEAHEHGGIFGASTELIFVGLSGSLYCSAG